MAGRPPSEGRTSGWIARSLASEDPAQRRDALAYASRISRIDPPDRPAVEEAVTAALRDHDPDVRIAAIRALVRMGMGRSLHALIQTAGEDPAPEVRREAVAALARLIPSAAPA